MAISTTITNTTVTISNSGAYASPLTVTSTGYINHSNSGTALYGPTGLPNVTVNNQGRIVGAAAVQFEDGGTFTNSGTVQGSSNGIQLFSSSIAGTIKNSGTIKATNAVYGYGITMNGGYVSNASVGYIHGAYWALDSGGVTALTLVNAGKMTSSYTNGSAVELTAGGMLTNSGTINGGSGLGVRVQSIAGTVIDSGSISGSKGAIYFGASNDVLQLEHGYSLSGGVSFAGASTGNTLELLGAAGAVNVAFDAVGAGFTKFGTVAFGAPSGNTETLTVTNTSGAVGTITGFTKAHDVIDLSGVAGGTITGGTVNGSNQLVISNGVKTVTLQLDAESYTGVTWQTGTDGGAGTDVSVAPPVVVTAGTGGTFDGGGSAVSLGPALTVTDSSSTMLAGATVTIVSPITGDTLNFTNQNGISGVFSSGTLTLSGTASVANYQTALESVTYSFTPGSGDPTNGGGDISRTIQWAASDSSATSNVVTNTLTTVHEPPVVTASGTVTFAQGGPTVALDPSVTLTDPDSSGNIGSGGSATVKVAGGVFATDGDTLAATTTGTSITATYTPSTETLSLTGADTVAHYQQVLQSVTFSSTGATAGSRTIDWSANDGVSASATSTSTAIVHDKPTVSAGGTATFNGGGAAVALDSGLTLADASSTTLTGATVTIVSPITGDTLNFTNQNGITGNYASGVLTLSGTTSVANYQTALDSITYGFSPSSGDPTNGGGDTSRTIDWAVSDGTATSTTATSSLTTVHEPPVVTASGNVSFVLGGSPVAADAGVTLSDPDSSGNISSATVKVASGVFSTDGDTLAATVAGTSIGTAYTPSTETLALTGTDTVAHYLQVLQSVTFSSTGATGGSRTIDWSANDGVSSSVVSTSTVGIRNQPVVTAGGTATFNGGGSPKVLDSGLTLADASSTTLASATVTIVGAIAGDTLNFTNQNGITGNYASGVLTLSGTASLANYQTALESITFGFSPSFADPTFGGADTGRTIDWTVNDGTLSSAVATSSLTLVQMPINVPASTGYNLASGNETVTLAGGDYLGLLGGSDSVSTTGSNTIATWDNTYFNLSGGNDTVNLSSSDYLGLLGGSYSVSTTGNDTIATWDNTYFNLSGGNDTVQLSSNDYLGLLGGSYSVSGTGDTIATWDNTSFNLSGNNDTVQLSSNDYLGLLGGSYSVSGTGDTIATWDNTSFNLSGNNDTVNLSSNDYVGLLGGSYSVSGTKDTIATWNGTDFNLSGGKDTVELSSNDYLGLLGGTGYSVSGTGDTIATWDNTRFNLTGGGNTVDLSHNDYLGLLGGGGGADTVTGFSEGSDYLLFSGENASNEAAAVASAQLVSGNTVLTLPNQTSLVLVGVTHVDTGIFA